MGFSRNPDYEPYSVYQTMTVFKNYFVKPSHTLRESEGLQWRAATYDIVNLKYKLFEWIGGCYKLFYGI